MGREKALRGRLFGSLLLLVVILVAAGCGGGGDQAQSGGGNEETGGEEETTPTTAVAASSVPETIQMTEFEFNPANITLDGAGTYVFSTENSGGAPHALEIEGNGIEAATEVLSSGQSAELEVDLQPGTYRIYCPVGNHEALGMVGTLTVV